VTPGEIDRLPDPDLFRDAMFLAGRGTWTARDLDDTDALLVALIRTFHGSA
jgi:hypothetical protein